MKLKKLTVMKLILMILRLLFVILLKVMKMRWLILVLVLYGLLLMNIKMLCFRSTGRLFDGLAIIVILVRLVIWYRLLICLLELVVIIRLILFLNLDFLLLMLDLIMIIALFCRLLIMLIVRLKLYCNVLITLNLILSEIKVVELCKLLIIVTLKKFGVRSYVLVDLRMREYSWVIVLLLFELMCSRKLLVGYRMNNIRVIVLNEIVDGRILGLWTMSRFVRLRRKYPV